MAPKSFLVTGLLVMLVVAEPVAEAQFGTILDLVRIQGRVPCSQNISAAINGTLTPVFPNAQVQLTCGDGNIIATATTNAAGLFSMALNPEFILFKIPSDCRLVVLTPLSNCNHALPAMGVLQSPLQLVGNSLLGLLNIRDFIPAGFQFLQV